VNGWRHQQARLFQIRRDPAVAGDRYEVTWGCAGSPEAETVAYAEGRGTDMPDRLVFYTDRTMSWVLFVVRTSPFPHSRDAVHEVRDGSGAVIGSFQATFAASPSRPEWTMRQGRALLLTGRERGTLTPALRHAWDVFRLPQAVWSSGFDFTTGSGERALCVDRARERHGGHVLDVASPVIDRRLAIAQAVALDSLWSR
jgi:hypothetical protein